MDTYYQSVDRTSASAISEQPILKSKSINKGGYLLIALGIITLIGSLVASGCLYAQLGYVSFAIGAAGIVFCILSSLSSKYCCVNTVITQHTSQKTQETNNQLNRRESPTRSVDINNLPNRSQLRLDLNTQGENKNLSSPSHSIPPKVDNKIDRDLNTQGENKNLSSPSRSIPPKVDNKMDRISIPKTEPTLPPLPHILSLKLDSTSSLLKALPKDMFCHNPFGFASIHDSELLDIPLQFWITQNTKEYSFMVEHYLKVMSDPNRALQVTAIKDRIEALDQAIQLKERVQRLKHQARHLTIETILPAWPEGILKFMLMEDDELAQLTVSSIKPEEDRKPLWDTICCRLHALADKSNIAISSNVNIDNIRLVDLTKLKANQINSCEKLFPLITFCLIEFQEFTQVAINKITNPQEVIRAIFYETHGGKDSEAAKRFLACQPEIIYQLSPYLPRDVWSFLGQPLIAQIDFSKLFTAVKDEQKKNEIIKIIFYETDGGKDSEAAKRLQAMHKPQIDIIRPYLPSDTIKFITT